MFFAGGLAMTVRSFALSEATVDPDDPLRTFPAGDL